MEGRRELRRSSEASPFGVEGATQPAERGVHDVAPWHVVGGLGVGGAPGGSHQRHRVLLEVVPTVAPHVVEGVEHLEELLLGEVGAAPERAPVGVERHRHRPPAPAGEGLNGVHVDGVDVGALLAIDLDVDELGVHRRRHLVVLERFMGHHVAPMARRVPDAQQHRHVAGAGLGERLVAPWVPIDRIVAMLTQVRRRLVSESIESHRVKRTVRPGLGSRPA